MTENESGGSFGGKSLETARDEFVGERDGNYAHNLEYALGEWIKWCKTQDRQTLEEITTVTMRNYALHLKRRVQADAISASTARTYYNYVSALLNRSVEVGDLVENPAEKREARTQLPTATTNSGDQQFW